MSQACCACGAGFDMVDVLVVVTQAANGAQGGYTAMQNLIHLSMYQLNVALSNSGSSVRARLVSTYIDPTFSDPGGSQFGGYYLGPLTTPGDGKFDGALTVQDNSGADVVVVIAEGARSGQASAIGSRIYTNKIGFAEVRRTRSAMQGDFTFAHEVGHLLNARHNHDTTPGTNHGYIDSTQCWHTIMAYPQCPSSCGGNCPSILQFSNIVNTYNGRPTGTSTYYNNGEAISNFGPTLAAQKPSKSRSVELCKHRPCEAKPYFASHLVGDWAYMPPDIGDQSLSQVIIPQGYQFEYFDWVNYNGYHRAYGSRSGDVTLDLTGGHNDDVSSFKVRQIPSNYVLLCPQSFCSSYYYVDSWNYSTFPSGYNGSTARIWIPRGYKVQVFSGADYTGTSSTKSNTVSNWQYIDVATLGFVPQSMLVSVA